MIATARATPGLEEWRAEVSAELAGDPTDVAPDMLHPDDEAPARVGAE